MEEITDKINDLVIDCPDCEDMYSDDQYTCTTCWCEGGQGTIRVVDWLRENPSLIVNVDVKVKEPIQNLIGLIDTPIGRRKFPPEVIENIKTLKSVI